MYNTNVFYIKSSRPHLADAGGPAITQFLGGYVIVTGMQHSDTGQTNCMKH